MTNVSKAEKTRVCGSVNMAMPPSTFVAYPTRVRDPKERFSDRVDDYVRFRPGYPPALFELLSRECGLGPGCTVADVGSGTGILTRGLLAAGARVVGIEPNAAMRAAAEAAIGQDPRFESVDASAEATPLATASVDLVTAAQAFHWFDPARTRVELSRILRPSRARASVALIWNQRKDSPFNADYEAMLERFAPEYGQVCERNRAAEPKLRAFFAPEVPEVARFDHEQRFDAAGLRGRLMSSSYAPRAGDPLHAPMLRRLDAIFAAHEREGHVAFVYETLVWYGRLRPEA
jgi:SAM-dependent methyltransferase